MPSKSHFTLSKNISMGIVIAFIVQAATGIWWLAQLSERVSIISQWSKDSQGPIGSIDKIEARVDAIKENMDDLETRLNTLESNPGRHFTAGMH